MAKRTESLCECICVFMCVCTWAWWLPLWVHSGSPCWAQPARGKPSAGCYEDAVVFYGGGVPGGWSVSCPTALLCSLSLSLMQSTDPWEWRPWRPCVEVTALRATISAAWDNLNPHIGPPLEACGQGRLLWAFSAFIMFWIYWIFWIQRTFVFLYPAISAYWAGGNYRTHISWMLMVRFCPG